MAHTYHVNLKEALLEPEDWESLLADKEYKISLTESPDTIPIPVVHGISPSKSSYVAPGFGVLLRRRLDGVVDATAGVVKAVLAFADRQNAEVQARAVLGRLRVAGSTSGGGWGYVGDVRMELLRLHRMALKGKYSVSTRTKIAQTRIRWVAMYLKSRPEPVDSVVYKDLIELLSLVCTDEYPATLLHEIWDTFLEELRSNGDARPMASALVQCDAGDVYLILRHLAASYVLAWSTIPSGQHAIHSETDARKAAQKLAFAWNTYDSYRRATEGFHRLIHGVLLESPSLVHAAFDDTRLHLLWLKFLPPNTNALSYGRIIDSAVAPFLKYPKHLRPDLPLELQRLVLFIATREHGALAIEGATHITTHGPHTYTYPTSTSGDLAHPALPVFLFAAELFRQSQPAAKEAITRGFTKTIFELWRAEFRVPVDSWPSTGRWVRPENRVKAMRLASTLVFSAVATHGEVYPLLAETVVADEDDEQTFWDVVAFALTVERAEEGWGTGWCGEAVRPLAFYVMKNHGRFPGDGDRAAAVGSANNVVWMLQSFGEPEVDARVRSFALDVLLAQIMAPSAEWKYAVAVLCVCQAHEVEALKATLSEFVEHFLHVAKTKTRHDSDKQPSNARSTSTNPFDEKPATFIRDPLDRFVMFISNATRTNAHVAVAVAESAVLQLVWFLVNGHMAGSRSEDVRVPGSWGGREGEGEGGLAREWRRRTWMEICQQRVIKETVMSDGPGGCLLMDDR